NSIMNRSNNIIVKPRSNPSKNRHISHTRVKSFRVCGGVGLSLYLRLISSSGSSRPIELENNSSDNSNYHQCRKTRQCPSQPGKLTSSTLRCTTRSVNYGRGGNLGIN